MSTTEHNSAGGGIVDPDQPLVSIVIPCFNTAAYVDDCVASAVDQTYANLEIVIVDDGSTDETTSIVQEWATRDGRITVLVQPNRGLGAARNAGIRAASGEYLTFLDSDDMLDSDAIRRMARSAEATGSDFVTGVARRFNMDRSWRASLYLSPFDRNRRRTHIFEQPLLVHDHIVCAKLFRRSFWDREGLEFPTGTLFEDIELAIRAHCLADSVDVISKDVYRWRARPAGDPSITQDRTRPGSVGARFAALTDADRYLREHAPPPVWVQHGRKVFDVDLPMYLQLMDVGDERYRNEFVVAAGELASTLAPEAVDVQGSLRRCLHGHLVHRNVRAVRGCARLIVTNPPRTAAKVVSGFALLPARDKWALGVAGVRVLAKRIRRGKASPGESP